MPGTTRELTNTSDFPRTTSLSGSEVLPAADGANPVALPVSLFQSKADADDQDSRISAVEGRDVGSSVGTYDTTAEGISATVSGEFFWAPNGDYLQLYENVSEVATAQENVVLPLALVTQDIYEKIGPLEIGRAHV